jgi:hypothetical protein
MAIEDEYLKTHDARYQEAMRLGSRNGDPFEVSTRAYIVSRRERGPTTVSSIVLFIGILCLAVSSCMVYRL